MQMELMDVNSRMDEGRDNIHFRITRTFVHIMKVSILLQLVDSNIASNDPETAMERF